MARRNDMRIVVVGSSNTDLVLTCARLPSPGETLLGGKFERHAGGKGANQAVAAARAGARVSFIGAHGADEFGRAAKAGLRKEKIDVRHFSERADVLSGVALILIGGRSRENVIGVASSANDTVSPEDLAAAGAAFQSAGAVIAQLEVPLATVEAAARLAHENGAPFILNPAPARKLPVRLLRLVHTLVPNEHEATLMTGLSDPAQAARALMESGCRNVVVTLGARGALINGERTVAAPRLKPVDTVGAGDCFTAWLALGIAEKLPLEDAVTRAVRAASIAVTRTGAQSGMPYGHEVRHS